MREPRFSDGVVVGELPRAARRTAWSPLSWKSVPAVENTGAWLPRAPAPARESNQHENGRRAP